MFKTGWHITGLYKQNRILVIDAKALFYAQNDVLGHLTGNYETAALTLSYAAIAVNS